ncbi:hypothetical protein MNEG_16370 [Monoraphidium neglectum]|uniref:Protein kinase domain-containing protein n=1 Tax=Monoraphidium neglectum TaxID=145388 RepID=A0A0D2LHU7_9CHLO|nr:hypothetical protein MNEG_16370 [Monoraphidium neglectum]KIY91594.1 hypothetical protein MNEG_16370 [Monoraphidium neglectum]|eukprot:XP_013890614.1 hypothetical protein MNEG_16370 [Monoraphidium neglectum]
MWRGKKVAVKVMQLPADALLDHSETLGLQAGGYGHAGAGAARRRGRGKAGRQGAAPHMAIMEAVLSSTMSHPNVVQVAAGAFGVYTYYLNPTLVSAVGGMQGGDSLSSPRAAGGGGGSGGGGGGGGGGAEGEADIAGWTLKLVMEYCNEGSLRDALDCGLLCTPGSFLSPSSVLALSHDVASAMLHLHSEGIVHGDLKAHNVLLTGSSDPTSGMTNGRVWAASGSRRLTAKVGDFGLALPLQPSDTHATLAARPAASASIL